MKAKKKGPRRIRGPASRLSVRADAKISTPVIVRERKVAPKQLSTADQLKLTADTFNSIHARIALNDGLSPNVDLSMSREKLFEIISTHGWERTLQVFASCARLFAEVPTPLPPFPEYINGTLHKLAQTLDAQALQVRLVDREATKGHRI